MYIYVYIYIYIYNIYAGRKRERGGSEGKSQLMATDEEKEKT